MSELFQLQGMEQFQFSVSALYSSPHSKVFSLIATRDLAIQVKEDDNDDTLLTDEAEFHAVADGIAEQYIFASGDIRDRVFISVGHYLQQYPDERIEGFLAFSRRPENQPRLDGFSSGAGRTLSPRRSAALKSKKKMAAASKRKNRSKK